MNNGNLTRWAIGLVAMAVVGLSGWVTKVSYANALECERIRANEVRLELIRGRLDRIERKLDTLIKLLPRTGEVPHEALDRLGGVRHLHCWLRARGFASVAGVHF